MIERNASTEDALGLMKQASTLISIIEDKLELTLKDGIKPAVSLLHDYVHRRKLPDDEQALLWDSIMVLGGTIQMVSNNTYLGLMPRFLANDNAGLRVLLARAESYLRLDFPEEASWPFYGQDEKPLEVFSLEQIADLSGRSVGSIRNAALQGGGLKTVKITDVLDGDGHPVTHTVFVEHAEARRWLEEKNCYEKLQEEVPDDSAVIEFVRNYGPRFDADNLPDDLLMRSKGQLKVYYAPFEHLNQKAKVVLCGITPGAAQAEIALNTLARSLQGGRSVEESLKSAKQTASFAGPMRSSLAKMLDYVGLNRVLNIDSCAELFSTHCDLVHYTSALKNPVFYKGGNYTGTPSMLKEDALKWQVDEILAEEVKALDDTVLYIPLGPKPSEALMYLVKRGLLKREQILDGIPHPSGANGERIAYFCEEKMKDELSSRTNADLIDGARERIKAQVTTLLTER